MLHGLKSLPFQKRKLFLHGTGEINGPARCAAGRPIRLLPELCRFPCIRRIHQGKSAEPDIAPCRDLVVQLTHGAAAEIPGIFVLCLHVLNLRIDPLKIRVADHCLPPQHQLPPKRDLQGKIHKSPGIVRNDLADLPIAPGDRFFQLSAPISQHNGQPVQFPAQNGPVPSQPVPQRLSALGLVQGQHGAFMPLLGQLLHGLIAHIHRGAARHYHARLPLQGRKLVIERVVFSIADDFPVFRIISLGGLLQSRHQIFDPFYFLRPFHSTNHLP